MEKKSYHFLQGGGEMGMLTRAYDWSQTSLGAPDQWPQSLRITVSMILSSRFPMFLWWGDTMIQFYNDAYRPSLGNNGKHPGALGQEAKDCWPEIWNIIHPLIQQVQTTGEATWSEDQLIPIYRNGQIEDVYWTFGYSAIRGESEKTEGVLVVCTETTEKVMARKKIEESEERFRTMAEGTDIFIAVGDETGNAIYFNKAWVNLTGRPMEELLQFGWANLVHPKDRGPCIQTYLSAFENHTTFNGEFRVLGKEGEYRWLLAKGPPRFRPDGSFAGYICSCVDITERKQAENALQQTEQMLRSLVESAPFPIGVYIGKEKRIELANQAILDAWGKGNDVIGKSYAEVLPELDNQAIFNQLDNVLTTGIPFHARNQRVDLVVDGRLQSFYFNYSFIPLLDSSGKVYGVMNTAADITDLHLAKQKIEENEKNFRNTILKAPVAMCIFRGPEYIVEIANDQMIELWGKPAADILHKPIFESVPEVSGQGFEQLLANVMTTGETFAAQDVPVTLPRNGTIETAYINFMYAPSREADGFISGVLAIAIEVTAQVLARRKIEEVVAERTRELAETNIRLQKSNAELEQFAHITSHDLQEPVRKVGTFAQMLEYSLGNIDERSKNYLDKINKSTSRMIALIRDVLTYSELAKDIDVFMPVDLEQVVTDIQNDFELLIEQKNARIQYANLPIITAIPLQISQLFGNLLSNALKFSNESIPPVIFISAEKLTEEEKTAHSIAEPGNDYYRIEFKDNGIGFNQENAEQIFHIFQRLHGKADYSGTGIGLAMCKRIVQNHHGLIYATASPEKGAIFTIILPEKQTASSSS